jgi:hypothetical protein
MNHPQLGNRRRVKGAISLAGAPLFALLIGGASGPASAGEFDRSTLPAAVAGQERCYGQGVVRAAADCQRINGYIAAGVRFGSDELIGGRPSRFAALDAPEFVGAARASGVTIIEAPPSQDRLFPPPGSGDEAR